MKMKVEWSPEVEREINRIAEEVRQQVGKARYVVYAIIDPTKEDPCGAYPGLPFYVGETNNISERIERHFKVACRANAKLVGRIAYIRDLLSKGVVARFVILQQLNTRFDGHEAEIRWSQNCQSALNIDPLIGA